MPFHGACARYFLSSPSLSLSRSLSSLLPAFFSLSTQKQIVCRNLRSRRPSLSFSRRRAAFWEAKANGEEEEGSTRSEGERERRRTDPRAKADRKHTHRVLHTHALSDRESGADHTKKRSKMHHHHHSSSAASSVLLLLSSDGDQEEAAAEEEQIFLLRWLPFRKEQDSRTARGKRRRGSKRREDPLGTHVLQQRRVPPVERSRPLTCDSGPLLPNREIEDADISEQLATRIPLNPEMNYRFSCEIRQDKTHYKQVAGTQTHADNQETVTNVMKGMFFVLRLLIHP